jgi:hypothetical protein
MASNNANAAPTISPSIMVNARCRWVSWIFIAVEYNESILCATAFMRGFEQRETEKASSSRFMREFHASYLGEAYLEDATPKMERRLAAGLGCPYHHNPDNGQESLA